MSFEYANKGSRASIVVLILNLCTILNCYSTLPLVNTVIK